MIREQAKYFGPLFFAVVSFCFYMVIYRPSIGSEDFITALMVFCAALACSAVLILTKEKKQWVLYLYISIALIFPLLMALFLNGFNILWHMAALGLFVLGVAALRLFIAGYLKYKKEE